MQTTNEIWKDIQGYEGLYEISNFGRIKSLGGKSNHIEPIYLKIRLNKFGYEYVRLQKSKKVKYVFVHRLVAEAFIPNPNNLPQVNHKSGIKTDNNSSNLEWVTSSENRKHGFKLNLIKPTSKKVYQYDKEGNLIKSYGSVKEANEKTNIYYSGITRCCRKEIKSAGGYVWEYGNPIN